MLNVSYFEVATVPDSFFTQTSHVGWTDGGSGFVFQVSPHDDIPHLASQTHSKHIHHICVSIEPLATDASEVIQPT